MRETNPILRRTNVFDLIPSYGIEFRTVSIASWAVATLIGFAWMAQYSYQSGALGTPPAEIGQQFSGAFEFRDPDRPVFRILLFIHPHCPCTWASARELRKSIEVCGQQNVRLEVFVFRPSDKPIEWSSTRLCAYSSEIDGTGLHDDVDGKIAASFGATTSGTVLVYNPEEKLEFFGGVTSSRGHEGDSIGSQALINIVCGHPVEIRSAPVFGCRF